MATITLIPQIVMDSETTDVIAFPDFTLGAFPSVTSNFLGDSVFFSIRKFYATFGATTKVFKVGDGFIKVESQSSGFTISMGLDYNNQQITFMHILNAVNNNQDLCYTFGKDEEENYYLVTISISNTSTYASGWYGVQDDNRQYSTNLKTLLSGALPPTDIIGTGGGATHVAKVTGLLSTLSSNLSDVLIVAGGGGGGMIYENTAYRGADAGGIAGNSDTSGNQSIGYSFGQGESPGGGGGLHGGYSAFGGGGQVGRLWIVSEDVMAKIIASVGVVAQYPGLKDAPAPYAYKAEGYPIERIEYNGDTYWHYISSSDNSITSFLTKIPGGVYNNLYIDISSSEYSSNWNMCNLDLSTTGIVTGYYNGNISGYFKGYTLVNRRTTPEAINSQTGITINSVSSDRLDRQTVIVDISDITDDFYVGFHVCQNNTKIYNIYADV